MRGRGLGNETGIQSGGLSVQVLDISLDKSSGQENGIKLGLLGDDG